MEEIKLVQVSDNYHLYNFTNDVYDVSDDGNIEEAFNSIKLNQEELVLDKGITCFKLGILLDDTHLDYINNCIRPNASLTFNNKDLKFEAKLVNTKGETELIISSSKTSTLRGEDGNVELAYFKSDIYYWDSVNVERNYGELIRKHTVDHPYYPATYDEATWSSEDTWSSVDKFLAEYKDADLDYNLVIRWDLVPVGINVRDMIITIWHQRKSHIVQHRLSNIDESDMPKLIDYLETHRGHLDKMWFPIKPKVDKLIQLKYVKNKHTQNWVCDEDPNQTIPRGTLIASWFRGDKDIEVELTLKEDLPLNECLGLLEEEARQRLEEDGHDPEVNPNFIERISLKNNRIYFHVGT